VTDQNDRRTVHAWDEDCELVRYDRPGKWYIEPNDYNSLRPARQVTVQEAVRWAMEAWYDPERHGGVRFGVTGGSRFDLLVRRAVEARKDGSRGSSG
jgi:hypothetical protein